MSPAFQYMNLEIVADPRFPGLIGSITGYGMAAYTYHNNEKFNSRFLIMFLIGCFGVAHSLLV